MKALLLALICIFAKARELQSLLQLLSPPNGSHILPTADASRAFSPIDLEISTIAGACELFPLICVSTNGTQHGCVKCELGPVHLHLQKILQGIIQRELDLGKLPLQSYIE